MELTRINNDVYQAIQVLTITWLPMSTNAADTMKNFQTRSLNQFRPVTSSVTVLDHLHCINALYACSAPKCYERWATV